MRLDHSNLFSNSLIVKFKDNNYHGVNLCEKINKIPGIAVEKTNNKSKNTIQNNHPEWCLSP